MNNQAETQKRVVLATAIAFIFFIAYDYFFMPKQQIQQQAQTTQQEVKNNISNTGNNKAIEAPITSSTKQISVDNNAPTNSYDIIATINSKNFKVEIDTLGRISQFYLKEEKYKEDGEILKLFDSSQNLKPLEIRFSKKDVNSEAFKKGYSVDKSEIHLNGEKQTLILTQKLSSLTITKYLTFYPNGKYDLEIKLSKDLDYFVSTGFRPNANVGMYTFHGVLLKEFDDTLTMIDDGDAIGNQEFKNIPLVAGVDQYYTTCMFNFSNRFNAVISKDKEDNPLIFIEGSQEFKINGYIGAKEFETLNAINTELTSVIEYGFFTLVAKPIFTILQYIHNIIGNWGWSIVVLTALIRIALYPLTYKGMVSMQKLKELAPKVKEIQAKYKGEPQKMQMHMMDLYKKNGANPMGGCLPMILQIPVFFAIYRVLLNAIELKGAEWIFWINDLSLMDPYYVLPVLMGGTMFLQQMITPSNFTDPLQEKMFKFLPLIFTFFFITFPAGLTLYWFINNLFSVGQQYMVNKIFATQKKMDKK